MIVKRNTVILYHATKRKNLSSILKHGLDPNFAKPYQPTPEEIKVYLNSKGIYLDSYEPRVPSYYIPGIIWLGDEELSEADKSSSDAHFKFLKDDTYTIKGDIDPKYIKESKKYNKYKLRDFGKYVKNNPKRFIKGVGKASLGGGLISLGSIGLVKFGKKLIKNNKKEEKK